MMSYLLLFFAIVFEVLGTMMLPLTHNFSRTIPSIILGLSYGTSFYLLSIVSQKLPLGVIYASWAGLGIFLVAILSYFIYKQAISWQAMIGLVLIVVGVALVNFYKV